MGPTAAQGRAAGIARSARREVALDDIAIAGHGAIKQRGNTRSSLGLARSERKGPRVEAAFAGRDARENGTGIISLITAIGDRKQVVRVGQICCLNALGLSRRGMGSRRRRGDRGTERDARSDVTPPFRAAPLGRAAAPRYGPRAICTRVARAP